METPVINNSKRNFICTTILSKGDNDELVFTRSYRGDWGHWDDKIETTTQSDIELDNTELDAAASEQQMS